MISLVLFLLGSSASEPSETGATIRTTGAVGITGTTKKVFSSRLRLVFFVGLEGTGHHYMSHAFHLMYEKYPNIKSIPSCDIGRSLYLPLSMFKTSSHYQMARERVRAELRSLLDQEKELGSEGTIVTVQLTSEMQKSSCVGYGELSYPNDHGPNKALKYPDVQMLSRAAEEEGVDFRVLYLQRSAKALLVSNVSHRGFHK